MNKVLLIVDMQNGFMNHENYKKLSKKIDEYIRLTKYDLYIFTKFINKKKSLYENKLNWTNLQDNVSQSICVNVPDKAIIIEKNGYGLAQKDLEKIKKLGVKTIDICGLQTDACVYAISFQLWDNEIFPNILINYTATDPAKEKQAKQMLIHQFGKVDETSVQ